MLLFGHWLEIGDKLLGCSRGPESQRNQSCSVRVCFKQTTHDTTHVLHFHLNNPSNGCYFLLTTIQPFIEATEYLLQMPLVEQRYSCVPFETNFGLEIVSHEY